MNIILLYTIAHLRTERGPVYMKKKQKPPQAETARVLSFYRLETLKSHGYSAYNFWKYDARVLKKKTKNKFLNCNLNIKVYVYFASILKKNRKI